MECTRKLKEKITISSDPSPLFLAIPFAFDFAFKIHIKEKKLQALNKLSK